MQGKTKKTFHSNKYKDQEKLNGLTNLIVDNIGDIYDHFGVKYRKQNNLYLSQCMIHGGDNMTALNFYHNADYRPHFKCRTHLCENTFGTSAISMIRGALSHQNYKWVSHGDKTATFDETIEFLLNFFSIKFNEIEKVAVKVNSHSKFCQIVNTISGETFDHTLKIKPEIYRNAVELPSRYFINRGYTLDVLDKYEVGECHKFGKEMYNRAVVPIYDNDKEYIIGITGRSIFEECKKCRSYHSPASECKIFPKWRHSKGFNKEKSLYNYWFAKEHITRTHVVGVVESPGNVWRLVENGIHNVVGIYGTDLSEYQLGLLDESGALVVVIILDNDENNAGQKGASNIIEKIKNRYKHINVIIKSCGDIGDCDDKIIQTEIKPWFKIAEGMI